MYEEIYKTYKEVAKDNIDRPLFNNSNELNEEMIEDIKNNKIVIYTAFTGNYDELKEPEFIDENCDYICFTDRDDLKSDFWEIRKMEDSFLDNNRKAKQYKIFPNKFLSEYKYSFWLDSTFKIKGSIRQYIYNNLKKNSNMLTVIHTERDCIYKEYNISKKIPRYPSAVMKEQVTSYKKEGFPANYGLAVMGAIFRKHNDEDIINLMNGWWDEIIKFSNQDQLSFAYVAWKQDFHPSVSLIYYWNNEYWSKEEGYYHHNEIFKTPLTINNFKRKLLTRLNEMDLNDKIELSREETYLLINNFKAMKGYRQDTINNIDFLNSEYEKLLSSNSLKVTKPLRIVEEVFNNIKYRHDLYKLNNNQKDAYKVIKNLNLINSDKYLKLHPTIRPNEVVLDYIKNGSVNDTIDEKYSYINPLFDLFYYISSNELMDEDPLIHYASKRFVDNLEINPKKEGFVKNFNEDIDTQYNNYIISKIRNEINSNRYITNSDILIPYIEGNELYDTDSIKVGVFLEDSFDNMNACPFIRIHTPFKELSKSNNYHFFVYGKELLPQIDMNSIINKKIFDVVVIQRSNPYATEILKRAKKLKIKIIYETDDFLLNIKKDNNAYNEMQRLKPGIIKSIDNADVVTTSTTQIANKFKEMGKKVKIIRNYQLNNVESLKPFKSDKNIKIGYFGTFTHSQDLKLIENPMKELIKKYNVKFEVIGVAGSESDWYTIKKLPYYPMSSSTFMKWLVSQIDWDIGIAPLVNNDFNRCKSELKYIEYTTLGIPTVASDIEGYREVIIDRFNGFLAKNQTDWINKISKLIEDDSFRYGMVNNARENILKNYNLNSRVKQWDELFEQLVN